MPDRLTYRMFLICSSWLIRLFCYTILFQLGLDITSLSCINYIVQEEMMRGKPGYEHLNEPLHILVEAELPVEIIDARLMQAREILEDLLRPVVLTPVLCLIHQYWNTHPFRGYGNYFIIFLTFQDESHDFYKKQQLRELAMINGTLRDEGSPMSGSVSPFHNSLGMKRAKTRG